jgi:hypothetical protein
VEKESPTSKSVEPQTEKKSVPPEESVSSGQLNLEQIWQRVVATIQRPSTQEFLRQKAKLIDFRDGVARVSMPNQALLRHLTSQKVANIEAAFSQVVNYPVKVKVEVAGNNTANDVSANYYASGGKSNPGSNGIKNGESSNAVEPIDSNNSQSLQRRYGDEEGGEDREAVAIASRKLREVFGGELVDLPAEMPSEIVPNNMNIAAPFEMPKID